VIVNFHRKKQILRWAQDDGGCWWLDFLLRGAICCAQDDRNCLTLDGGDVARLRWQRGAGALAT
jgi:hypothetical protein